MEKFQCDKCGNQFEQEGTVYKYQSPVYGPCSKKVADCPKCGSRSDEYRPPKMARSKASYQDAMPAMGGCGAGGCCQMNRQ